MRNQLLASLPPPIGGATGPDPLPGARESLELQLDRLQRRVHKLEHRLGELPLYLLLRTDPIDLRNASARIRARLHDLEERLDAGPAPRQRPPASRPPPRPAASRPHPRRAASRLRKVA